MKRMKKMLCSMFVVALSMVSLQALAETQAGGRDFNHMTTGFPLSGGHASAACETCHAGGVFKGTPRTCDACHAVGRRIVATPKSNSHIITDAPCESCHFNTATWLGARFNHGTVVPGQCATCHNGRISTGKHRAHIATTYSCDQCHRSSAWLPASWNHTGVSQDCSFCHKAGGSGRNYTTTAKHATFIVSLAISNCASCHSNYYSFYSHYYKHDKAFVSCGECHANPSYTTAGGVTQAVNAIHASATAVGISNCESCHVRSYTSFAGARYRHNDAAFGAGDCVACHNGTHAGITGIPSNHAYALANLLNAPAQCNWCHSTASTWAGMNHNQLKAGTKCIDCHLSGTSNFAGMKQKSYGHKHFSVGQDCISCHQNRYDYWNEP